MISRPPFPSSPRASGGKTARSEAGGLQHTDHRVPNRFLVVDYCNHGVSTARRIPLVTSFQLLRYWTLGLLPIQGSAPDT
jgi:hypothetical protein